MNGKGDKPRPVNKKRYDKNFKRIFKKLNSKEIDALKIVLKMAEGNMHCRRTDERKRAVRLVERMVK